MLLLEPLPLWGILHSTGGNKGASRLPYEEGFNQHRRVKPHQYDVMTRICDRSLPQGARRTRLAESLPPKKKLQFVLGRLAVYMRCIKNARPPPVLSGKAHTNNHISLPWPPRQRKGKGREFDGAWDTQGPCCELELE